MDEWDEFESGSSGGYEDLSNNQDVVNDSDWMDDQAGDAADAWLAKAGYNDELGNDPDSLLVGLPSDEAVLQARARASGINVGQGNIVQQMPEHMQPSAVTHYDLSSLSEAQRTPNELGELRLRDVMQANISTMQARDETRAQQVRMDKLVTAAQTGAAQNLDALPPMQGHADDLTREDFTIGGASTDQVMYQLAGQYLEQGTDVGIQKSLARQLAIQIPRTSRGIQASFGGDHMVSHMDALPLPSALPSRFQGSLRPTLNTSGGVYNPAYRKSREYRFASEDEQSVMDWRNRPSPMATLTGAPYQGMHKTKAQIAGLSPDQRATLETQKDIEANVKGFLSLAGLAKDVKGRKLSTDNTKGTATSFIRPVVGQDYYSPMDELARAGGMDVSGSAGVGGQEGAMSALGEQSAQLADDLRDVRRPFTAADIDLAQSGMLGDYSPLPKDYFLHDDFKKVLADEGTGVYKSWDRGTPTIGDALAAKSIATPKPAETLEEALAKDAPIPTVSSKSIEDDARTRAIAQENVESALRARGLNISKHEQGTDAWKKSREGILTSTGIGTSMGQPVYKGDTWKGHLEDAVAATKGGSIGEDLSTANPMFAAGERGEEAGKRWFEEKFNKKIVDLGLITDPSKPNQGTSVDGVIAGAGGELEGPLRLSEFKWGTQGRMPFGGSKKHQQQLQHQMYMTGAESAQLITGFDPNQFNPTKRGTESEFEWMSETVKRDPEWAAKNKDFIQARADEKASAVSGGDASAVRDGYLAALKERYPNESDKGLTKDEKAEKKRQVLEDREANKAMQESQKVVNQNLTSVATFLAGGAGAGGFGLGGAMSLLSRGGPVGLGAAALIGLGTGGYTMARKANDFVGEAADVGAESTLGFTASEVALRKLSFGDNQAKQFNANINAGQAMASVGEFDPMVKRLTSYRGLLSMEDLTQLSPEEITDKLRSSVDAGDISQQQLAGMALMAGDKGIARNFQTAEQRAGVLQESKELREKGVQGEAQLRMNVGEVNLTATNLNVLDEAKKELIQLGSTDFDKKVEPTWFNSPVHQFSSAVESGMGAAGDYASEALAPIKGVFDFMFNGGANSVVGDTTAGKGGGKIDANITVDVTKHTTEATLEASVDGVQQNTQRVVAKEE